MTGLLIHVEGQTEETFVNEVLAPHLYSCGFERVGARLVGNARQRSQRGGIRPWNSVRADIVKHLQEDRRCVATTLVDFYGLPATGNRAWPGREAANALAYDSRAKTVENAIAKDIASVLSEDVLQGRFLPYVIMHEFEGLLFSDCTLFANGIGRPELQKPLLDIRASFATPEHINDSPGTAPSKRILTLLPNYQKPLHGTLAALEIGIKRIRASCPQFNAWLKRLEERAK